MKGMDDPEAVSNSGESLQDAPWKWPKDLQESSDNCQAKKMCCEIFVGYCFLNYSLLGCYFVIIY